MLKRASVLMVIILFITACGFFESEKEKNVTRETKIHTDGQVSLPSISVPISGYFLYGSESLSTAHPFANALREYMKSYNDAVRAFLVTLDDDGTIGLMIFRTPTLGLLYYDFDHGYHKYSYESEGTLFYIQNDELNQTYSPGFVSGRYNRLVRRFYANTHLVEHIYKLKYGEWEVSTRLLFFSDEYIIATYGDYYIAKEFIAERDARARYAREKYGLVALLPPNFGHMRNTQHQNEQILTMTINCEPRLILADTITYSEIKDGQISVFIDDIPISFATGHPISKDGCVLVPIECFDILGFTVRWIPQAQEFRLGAETRVNFVLNSSAFTVDNTMIIFDAYGDIFSFGEKRSHLLDVPVQIIEAITMIPVRGVLEGIGFYDVSWDVVTQTLTIMSLEPTTSTKTSNK